MTAAVQTSWQVSGSIQMVVHEQKKCNNFDVRPRPWGKRPVNLPCFWQCIVDLCIALVIWVQLVAICIRWSASVANRVTGVFHHFQKSIELLPKSFKTSSPESHAPLVCCRFSFRHLFALVLLCILHRGEASNPGPQRPEDWTLGVCNPSGLNGKQQILNNHLNFVDVLACSETHLSSGAMQAFKAGLWTANSPFKYCIGGHPCPLRPHSEHAGSWLGVSVLSISIQHGLSPFQ